GHGGSAAASASPRAAPPTSLAALASPPHSPDATPSLPPAGAASPNPRSPAPSPSRPDPARPDADHWTDARGSDGCQRCAPGRCSSSAGPPRRSTETSPASSSGSPSGTASTPPSPRARPSSSPPGASAPAVAPAVAAPSSSATPLVLFEVALFDSPLIRSPRGTPWDVTAGAAWQALFARRVSPSSPPVASVRAVRLPDARPWPIRRFAELA